MTPHTNSQKMAQVAYQRVHQRFKGKKATDKFASFARNFPSLVHSCGLAQSVAFGKARDKGKKEEHYDYLEDFAAVLVAAGHSDVTSVDQLEHAVRTLPVSAYVRLSRHALQAAGWLKRYVEAVEETPHA